MSAGEILKYFTQKTSAHLSVEPKDSLDDMIGTGFIRWIEVARLSRRLEGPDDDPRRVRPQIKALAIQEFGLGQGGSLWAL